MTVVKKESVAGGDINNAFRIELSDGRTVFEKSNTMQDTEFFKCEALGLECLKKTGAIGVPAILGMGNRSGITVKFDEEKYADQSDLISAVAATEETDCSFLLLEYLNSAPKIDNYWQEFGHQLAAMHKAPTAGFTGKADKKYGFMQDNYIGFTPQINTPSEKWTDFFRDSRLAPQFKRAWSNFDDDTKKRAEVILNKISELLPEPEFPSLLHGDLWSGNVFCGPDGKGWILDPAAYVGHFEADLAMTSLFGGFPASFYNSYDEVNRLDPDFIRRSDLYNLYHLVNHLNMFGLSYLDECVQIIKEYS